MFCILCIIILILLSSVTAISYHYCGQDIGIDGIGGIGGMNGIGGIRGTDGISGTRSMAWHGMARMASVDKQLALLITGHALCKDINIIINLRMIFL